MDGLLCHNTDLQESQTDLEEKHCEREATQ